MTDDLNKRPAASQSEMKIGESLQLFSVISKSYESKGFVPGVEQHSIAASRIQIGDTCSLYKTCAVCGEIKYYRLFARRGGGKFRKRNSHCISCGINRKDDIVKLSTPPVVYNFDVTKLDASKYGFIYFCSTGGTKWQNEITLEEASRFVPLEKHGLGTLLLSFN